MSRRFAHLGNDDDDDDYNQQQNTDYADFDGNFVGGGANMSESRKPTTNNNNQENNVTSDKKMTFNSADFEDDDDDDLFGLGQQNNNNNNPAGASNLSAGTSGSSASTRHTTHGYFAHPEEQAYVGSSCGPLFHKFWTSRDDPRQSFDMILELATKQLGIAKSNLKREWMALKRKKQRQLHHHQKNGDDGNENNLVDQTVIALSQATTMASSSSTAVDASTTATPTADHNHLRQHIEKVCAQELIVDRLVGLVNIDRARERPNADYDIRLPLPVQGSLLSNKQQQRVRENQEFEDVLSGDFANQIQEDEEAKVQKELEQLIEKYKNHQQEQQQHDNTPQMMMMMNTDNQNQNQNQNNNRQSSSLNINNNQPHFKPHQANGIRFLWESLVVPLQTHHQNAQARSNPNGEKIKSTGAILAQSMGLGKTCQALCFIHLLLKHVERNAKILVVVPTSVVISWLGELQTWKEHFSSLGTVNVFDLGQSTCIQKEFSMQRRRTVNNDNDNDDDDAILVGEDDAPTTAAAKTKNKKKPAGKKQQQKKKNEDAHDDREENNNNKHVIQKWLKEGGIAFVGYEKLRTFYKHLLRHQKANNNNTNLGDHQQLQNMNFVDDDDDDDDIDINNDTNPTGNKRKKKKKLTIQEQQHQQLMQQVSATLYNTSLDLIICDEAHRLRNHQTAEAFAVKKLIARRRLALTGTPLQNRLMDYWAMIDFAIPGYFEKSRFQRFFQSAIDASVRNDATEEIQEKAKTRMYILQKEIERFVQRVDPAVLQSQLPPLTEIVLFVPFSTKQHQVYEDFRNDLLGLQRGRTGAGTGILRFWNAISRIGIHPIMFNNFSLMSDETVDDAIEQINNNKNKNNNQQQQSSTVKTIAPTHQQVRRQRDGNQMMMMMDSSGKNDRSKLIEQQLNDMSDFDDFEDILQEEKKEASLSRTKKENTTKTNKLGGKKTEEIISSSSSSSSCDDNDDDEDDLLLIDQANPKKNKTNKNNKRTASSSSSKKKTATAKNNKPKAKESKPVDPNRYDKKKWTKSVKTELDDGSFFPNSPRMELFLRLLRRTMLNGECALVFSHSTKILDLVEVVLDTLAEKDSWGVSEFKRRVRIDGSVSLGTRMNAVAGFQNSKNNNNTATNPNSSSSSSDNDNDSQLSFEEVQSQLSSQRQNIEDTTPRIFLLSTKAGGVGLTLHRASRVFMLDHGWNPADERQAIGRAYRFGQTRPVFVYRFVAWGTFEADVFRVKLGKEWLFSTVVDSDNVTRENLTGFTTQNVLRNPMRWPMPTWRDTPASSRIESTICLAKDRDTLERILVSDCCHIDHKTCNEFYKEILVDERSNLEGQALANTINKLPEKQKMKVLPPDFISGQNVLISAMRWSSLLPGDPNQLFGEKEHRSYQTFLENGGLGSDLIVNENDPNGILDGDDASFFGGNRNGRKANLMDVQTQKREMERGSSILASVMRNALERRNSVSSQQGQQQQPSSSLSSVLTAASNLMKTFTSSNNGGARTSTSMLNPPSLQQRSVFGRKVDFWSNMNNNNNNSNTQSGNNDKQQQQKPKQQSSNGAATATIVLDSDDDEDAAAAPPPQRQQRKEIKTNKKNNNNNQDDVVDLISSDDEEEVVDDNNNTNNQIQAQDYSADVPPPQEQPNQQSNPLPVEDNQNDDDPLLLYDEDELV